jgi:hypothetical protein
MVYKKKEEENQPQWSMVQVEAPFEPISLARILP